ncbi:MAG TPA: HPF/RaiA family ribosome-associated protein [Hanamia sp.]|nr:HPF/RaiA family ribosome-associated protein [Hanamia sp.]
MQINLQTLKFNAKQELKDYVDEKVGKLAQYDDKIIRADVTLSLNADVVENKVCEIRLVIPGNDDFVKKNATTFEEAIHSSVDILQKVLRRKKEQA